MTTREQLPVSYPKDARAGLQPRRPTSALEHVLVIDALTRPGADVSALSEDSAGTAGADARNFAAMPVPWQHGGQLALTTDTDHDGIPDAFDFYFGAGAYAPGT